VKAEVVGGVPRGGDHLETDLADHAPVPQARQLVSVVLESCAACGQVREAYLNH